MKAIVVLSGGQDSATCLLWALNRFDEVDAISFDYGQRHRIELECAKEQCETLGVKHVLVDFSFVANLGTNALTDHSKDVRESGGFGDLPTTFVPGRNLLFLNAAAAYAVNNNSQDIVTGVCQTDFSGYPDCRHATMSAMEAVLMLGMDTEIRIHTPLMYLTKADTWRLARDEHDEGLSIIRDKTHTCYEGDHETYHDWGYGCGECPACKLREAGYAKLFEY